MDSEKLMKNQKFKKYYLFLRQYNQIICSIFAPLNIVKMKKIDFPSITTVVQAEPWEKGHIARITSFRPVTNTPKQHKPIVASVLPK